MTNAEAIAYFEKRNEDIISIAKNENVYNHKTQQIEAICMRETFEANNMAIQALGLLDENN